jgi:hypothetical protein
LAEVEKNKQVALDEIKKKKEETGGAGEDNLKVDFSLSSAGAKSLQSSQSVALCFLFIYLFILKL